MARLNLGCGKQILDGWINLDITDFGQQVVRDITRGLPFADDTFDEILADNVLEHVKPGEDSIFVMNEIYRVCRPGAQVLIIVPHALSQGAHQDPTHVNYFVPRSALYWNLDLPWPAMYGSSANFDVTKVEITGDAEREAFIRFSLTARQKHQDKTLASGNGYDQVSDFHRLYYRSNAWRNTFYRGIPTAKCPLDMWVYQEIIHEVKPDVIVETGSWCGGSARFLADQFNGDVISVDVDLSQVKYPGGRAQFIQGSSVDPEVFETVKGAAKGKAMVILDSDHSKAHVLKELDLYAPLVSVGSYLIVEDTNVNGHPIEPDFGPGPGEAIAEWLPKHPEFEVDESRHKFLMTFNHGGYLRKVR